MAIGTPVHRYSQNLGAQGASSVFSPASTIASGTRAILTTVSGNQDKVVSSVTDSVGNTWSVHATYAPVPPGVALSVSSCHVTTQITTGNTITVNYTGGTDAVDIEVFEVSGLATSSAFDQTSTGVTTTGTAIAAGTTGTLAQADEIAVVALACRSFAGFTAGATWTGVTCADSGPVGFEYKIVAATTAITPDGTQGGSAASAGLTATFKGASSGNTYTKEGFGALGYLG